MTTNLKKITQLSHTEAKEFFLTNKAYFSLDLPKYFNFEELLNKLSTKMENKVFYKIKNKDPKNIENINYILFNNKDGKYDWRPYEIINPVMYISLLNCMFQESNWTEIITRINDIQLGSYIECQSIPIAEIKNDSYINKASNQINNWWNEIEQKSLELSLDYNYIFHTDIVDCYNSIYTHSIPWAIHTKEIAKEKRFNNDLVGNNIDSHLQSMSYGQTNGIPQGSALMDFIAEIVLLYGDELITTKIKSMNIQPSEFKILRFRDDYRIFVNDICMGENMLRIIAEELSSLGFKLHNVKTKYSNNVIQSSIKEDKMANFSLHKNNNLQKRLLLIHKFSIDYPNSGSLKKELGNLKKYIDNKKNYKNDNIPVIISILADIAYNNSKTFVEVSGILSTLFSKIDDLDSRKEIIEKVFNKLKKINNSSYFEIWFQRAILKDLAYNDIEFDEKLCRKVKDKDKEIMLWNIDWINCNKIKDLIKDTSIVEENIIENIPDVTEYDEIKIFDIYTRI